MFKKGFSNNTNTFKFNQNHHMIKIFKIRHVHLTKMSLC